MGAAQGRGMKRLALPFWRRLSVRLTAVVTLVVALTLGTVAWLVAAAQEEQLVAQVVRDAALFSETIRNSTHQDMLEDRRADAYLVMNTIGRQPGIERVRIFNKEGRVTFSTDTHEIGTLVDKKAESCYACHAANQPIVRLTIPSRSRVYTPGDHRVLGMVTPIYNEPSCADAACHAHPSRQAVLGVVDIGLSLADVDATTAAMRRNTFWLAGLATAALAFLVAWIERRVVVQPVIEVARGTLRIADGELRQFIPVRRLDEIGLLAKSFNQMAVSLEQTQGQLQELMENLERQVDERTAALTHAQAQLVQSEKLTSLGRLAASVAHEINNPLTGILTYAKLLMRMLERDDLQPERRVEYARQLQLVQRETERCTDIVLNLLEFARQRPLQLAETSIQAALEEAFSLVGHQMRLANVTLERAFASAPSVNGDAGQLRQAFVNIVLNACDAMPKGGALRVTLATAPNGDVLVTFTDSGVGIEPQHLSRILDPFFTTKEKGTGLGLSVVYGIVERHGGHVEIDSRPGRGTTVRIRLAAAGVPASAAGA